MYRQDETAAQWEDVVFDVTATGGHYNSGSVTATEILLAVEKQRQFYYSMMSILFQHHLLLTILFSILEAYIS